MRALNTEFSGNLHDKKCDKRKNEIIIFVAKYLKIDWGKSCLNCVCKRTKGVEMPYKKCWLQIHKT